MNLEQTKQVLMELAEQIAKQADDEAHNWQNVPGDVALREFATAIRKTNKWAARQELQ